jgi:class 3 adenylate cyclase
LPAGCEARCGNPSPQRFVEAQGLYVEAGVDARPQGLVTFLFTDIVGSTRLWEQFPAAMPGAFRLHERLVRRSAVLHDGFVYKMIGDAFQIAFASPQQALAAAIAAQRALCATEWGAMEPIMVRMGIHSTQTEERGNDYVGPGLNRLARMLAIAAGGQILVSQASALLLADVGLANSGLRDLGVHCLRDLIQPEHIFQVVAAALPDHFPSLSPASAGRAGRAKNGPAPIPGIELTKTLFATRYVAAP